METGKKMVESMKETAANVVGGGGGGDGGGGEPHYSHSTTGATGHSTGAHQMSALPGHGTGEPAGGSVVEGTVKTRPIAKGTGSGTGRATTAQNTHVGGGTNTGLTGTGYNG